MEFQETKIKYPDVRIYLTGEELEFNIMYKAYWEMVNHGIPLKERQKYQAECVDSKDVLGTTKKWVKVRNSEIW